MAPKRSLPWGWIITAVVIGGLALWGIIEEQSARDKIDGQNQAAALDSFTGSSGSADNISVFDLRTGDCIVESTGTTFINVTRIPCTSSRASREVIYSFTVSRSGNYPGDAYFSRQFENRCPLRATDILYPTSESWAAGDRTISCLAPVR